MKMLRLLGLVGLIWFVAACQASDFVERPTNQPQGRGLVYQLERELWTTDLQGQNSRRLTTSLATTSCPAYSVAPDGRRVAYRDRTNALWVASLSNGEARTIAANGVDDFAWFPNSQGVVYSSATQLTLVFLDGNREPQRFDLQGRRVRQPTWSPDHHTIAFYLLRAGGKADLAVMPFPATSVNDVDILDTFTMEPGLCPPPIRWAPDGTRLVAGDGERQSAYFLAGGSPIPLGIAQPPAAWAGDSRHLAYLDRKGRLVLRDLVSGETRTLVNSNVGHYAWSPQGRLLAYTLAGEQDGALMLLDPTAPQATPTPLVADRVAMTSLPQWSQDGNNLYLGYRTPKGGYGVGRVAVAGGPTVPIVAQAASFRLLERPNP